MAKVHRFKNPTDKIMRRGVEDLHQSNLTEEKYKALIQELPQLAGHFEEVDELPAAKELALPNQTPKTV
jgi:hypothetical protein